MASILIVEDERIVAKDVEQTVIRLGHRVLASVATGEDAIAAASRQLPDLVLVDIRIRGELDGIETAGILGERFDLPCIYLTAYADDETIARARATAPHGYLLKPFHVRELAAAIELALHRHDLCRRVRRRNRWYSDTLGRAGAEALASGSEGTERLATAGALVAGLAHELANPLAFVAAAAELLDRELSRLRVGRPFDAGAAEEAIRDVRDGVDRLARLVRDFRDLAEPGDEAAASDVREAADFAVRLAGPRIRERARFTVALAETPPVRGHEHRLGQVLVNLLVNAAQAIPAGDAERHEVELASRLDGDRVVVTVRDTGSGMAPETMARIFEPFFSTKPKGEGTGLGLAICRGIVRALGGDLAVESQPGAGTRFAVSLPVAPVAGHPPARPVAAARDDGPPPAPRGRILVVDDEPILVAALRRCLRADHDVVGVTEPEEALRLLGEGPGFDLVICDLQLPRIDGPAIHEAVARTRPAQAERMLFLTGGAFDDRTQGFLASVPGRRLDKPFEPDALRAAVRRFLADRGPYRDGP